jgi:hypothetical protein
VKVEEVPSFLPMIEWVKAKLMHIKKVPIIANIFGYIAVDLLLIVVMILDGESKITTNPAKPPKRY